MSVSGAFCSKELPMLSASLCKLMNQLGKWLRAGRRSRPMPCWMTRPQPWEPEDDPFATLEFDLVNGMKGELGYDKAAQELKKFEYPREEEGSGSPKPRLC